MTRRPPTLRVRTKTGLHLWLSRRPTGKVRGRRIACYLTNEQRRQAGPIGAQNGKIILARTLSAVAAIALTMVCLTACTETPADSERLIVRAATNKSFDDVIFELEFAITERNFRITGRNTIGKGLRERGYEDFPDVEVIHFCNLEYAREVLIVDPGYVAQMPCRITVHEATHGTVISLILLPEDHADERVNAFARRMNAILQEIVDFVLEEDTAVSS